MQFMRAQFDVPGVPAGTGMARRVTAAVLQGWNVAELSDDAQLVVSELLANAMEHAAGAETYEVELVRLDTGVRLYVADGSTIMPVVAELSRDHPRGRGLRIVEALSASWGSDTHDGGKRVWADLTLAAGPHRRPSGS